MAVVAVALVAAGGVVAWSNRDADRGTTPSVLTSTPPGSTAVSICGAADLGRYSALPASPADPVETLVGDVSAGTGAVPSGLAVVDGTITSLTVGNDGTTFTSYASDGRARHKFTVPAEAEGRAPDTFALTKNGDVVTRSGAGGATEVVQYAADGKVTRTIDLSRLDRGPITAVFGWSGNDASRVAAVAFDGSHQLALLRSDGNVDQNGPTLAWGPYPRFYPVEDGTLFVLSDRNADSSYITFRHYSATGSLLAQFGGTLQDGSANGGPQSLDHPTGVAAAPDGGFLLAGPTWRLAEVTADGVRGRMALSGKGSGPAFSFADLTPFVRHGDNYYFFSSGDKGVSLVHVGLTGMNQVLDAPVTYDINTASTVDRLGYGAGLVTDAPYDYFDATATPTVFATFDPWWGAVADQYELRYAVTGDPWVDPPVVATSGTVSLPKDGGRVPLTLPKARPGPYDVDAELVDLTTGTVRTSTCLHYSVGAPGATFNPATLADGANWGGAGPRRGVQLADELGIGSYRVQLDFGRLVPDVGATPSVANLDLGALPGAQEGRPFAELSQAAHLAAQRGVKLYVQVGQGGASELKAVDAGSWGAWAGAIAAAFAVGAPDLHLWAPWNEPNNTGFGDGGDYTRRVLEPFASAVRAVDAHAQIIGGNALNLVVPWYRQMIEAGACDALDIVGIHPYTGYNRSWDEESADGPIGQLSELNTALKTCGGKPPAVWDTESGWWSDGPANHWAQGYDVARSLLWMRTLGVDEWTYFFSEGGWGEGGFTWSLLQVGSFVKPGALAMSTVSALITDRPRPELVTTDIPFAHAMRLGATPGGSDRLLAVWTDDLRTEVDLTSDVDTSVTVTDVYGETRTMDVRAGTAVPIRISGSPLFLSAPRTATLAVAPPEATGPNVLTRGTVTASSSAEGADPSAVLREGGAGTSPWRSNTRTADGALDLTPWIRVDLATPVTIDRVAVESAGIRCCTSGLRDYTVSVQTADGAWHDVGNRRDLFAERTAILQFDPVVATAVRVQVPSTTERGVTLPSLNYSGQTAGLHPAWSPLVLETGWTASVVALAAYAPAAG